MGWSLRELPWLGPRQGFRYACRACRASLLAQKATAACPLCTPEPCQRSHQQPCLLPSAAPLQSHHLHPLLEGTRGRRCCPWPWFVLLELLAGCCAPCPCLALAAWVSCPTEHDMHAVPAALPLPGRQRPLGQQHHQHRSGKPPLAPSASLGLPAHPQRTLLLRIPASAGRPRLGVPSGAALLLSEGLSPWLAVNAR